MKTIVLVGLPPRGKMAEKLLQSGFLMLPADDSVVAAGILNAIIVDGFVIDLANDLAGGEALIESLQRSARWCRLPIVVIGASSLQHVRLSRWSSVVAVIPASQRSPEAIVAAVRRATQQNPRPAPRDAAPGRDAWEVGGEVGVSTRTLRQWIAADAARGGGS